MDNTIENCKTESQRKNVILCHPDAHGDPVVEIFGDVPDTLLAMVDEGLDSNRYQNEHPDHRATLEIGFRTIARSHRVRLSQDSYARKLTYAVLERCNVYGEWSLRSDADLEVAVKIALERHDEAAVEGPTVIKEWLHNHDIARWTDEDEYLDEPVTNANALVEYLTFNLGFTWEWAGWDQEVRFIEKGLVRVPGTKIVQNLEGEYVISPRCHYCGQKTGWCRCSNDLEDMREESSEKHICNECYYLRDFEDALAEYLDFGKVRQDIIDDITELMENMVPRSSDDEEVIRVEHRFESVQEAADFLVHRYEGEDFEVLEWYELIARYWNEWTERQQEHLDEAGDCDGYCECPLGV